MRKSRSRAKLSVKLNWAAIIAVVVACVIVVGVCCAGFASRDSGGTWFRNWNLSTWHWADADDSPSKDSSLIAMSAEGEKMYAGKAYAMPAGMTLLNPQAKSTDSAYSEGEFVVRARLSNPFIKGSYQWSLSFTDEDITKPNGAHGWEPTKAADGYVTVTELEEDDTAVKLKFIEPFGKRIKLSAKLIGTEKVGECVIDCLSASEYGGSSCDISDFDDEQPISTNFTYGVGTVKCEYYAETIYAVMKDEFKTAFLSYLTFEPRIQEISKTLSNKCWVENEYLNFSMLITWSDFMPEFEGYSDAKKQAIYYAWYRAAQLVTDCADYEYGITAYYNGQHIAKSDYGSEYGLLTLNGMRGATIAPDVDFNQDVTFG